MDKAIKDDDKNLIKIFNKLTNSSEIEMLKKKKALNINTTYRFLKIALILFKKFSSWNMWIIIRF